MHVFEKHGVRRWPGFNLFGPDQTVTLLHGPMQAVKLGNSVRGSPKLDYTFSRRVSSLR